MKLYQHVREDLFLNYSVCRIIYSKSDPATRLFAITPLALIMLTKLFGYALLTFMALATIYYTLHMVCLIDDACFAHNYGVKL